MNWKAEGTQYKDLKLDTLDYLPPVLCIKQGLAHPDPPGVFTYNTQI